jgi:phage FluMu protein Com
MKKTLKNNEEHKYRCPVCKRLLMLGKIIDVQTKCPKCKNVVRIRD